MIAPMSSKETSGGAWVQKYLFILSEKYILSAMYERGMTVALLWHYGGGKKGKVLGAAD